MARIAAGWDTATDCKYDVFCACETDGGIRRANASAGNARVAATTPTRAIFGTLMRSFSGRELQPSVKLITKPNERPLNNSPQRSGRRRQIGGAIFANAKTDCCKIPLRARRPFLLVCRILKRTHRCLLTGQYGRKIWSFKKPSPISLRPRHGKFDPGNSFKPAFSAN